MPNTSGADWDEGVPLITSPRREGAAEILNLRKAVKIRLDKEHVAIASSSAGGEHKEGSAKVYYQASAPTLRPDGSTSLGADDEGRLWIDSDNLNTYVWNGSAWTRSAAGPSAEIYQFEEDVSDTLPSLPLTASGLTNGTYIVTLYGASDYTDNEDPITISATINGVTRTIYLANQPDGNVPFSIQFHITVSAGTCSLTATSGIAWIGTMSGFLTVKA